MIAVILAVILAVIYHHHACPHPLLPPAPARASDFFLTRCSNTHLIFSCSSLPCTQPPFDDDHYYYYYAAALWNVASCPCEHCDPNTKCPGPLDPSHHFHHSRAAFPWQVTRLTDASRLVLSSCHSVDSPFFQRRCQSLRCSCYHRTQLPRLPRPA